ncbi:peptidase inhibitor family I36 protein [Streptomyces sp. NPDC005506]|uniref:peptidase inhibitor family I36 protein n=1 Tax=unclassified Streptomyces TaxID=2593676 RepID=UPI003692BBF0
MSARRMGVVGAITALAIMGAAGSASAASDDGSCESGEVCLYYNSNYQGGVWDSYWSDAEYTSADTFHGTGGQVNNNSASIRNKDPKNNSRQWQYYNWTGWAFVVLAYGDPNNQFTLFDPYKNAFSSGEFFPYGS